MGPITAYFLLLSSFVIVWLIFVFNNLVKLRSNRDNAFANIDVQLKLRYDLVPQLVATVKGYATHEQELLEAITDARAAALNATSRDDKIHAEDAFAEGLAGLKFSLEAYPDLKANQEFLQLQNELTDIENKIAASRRFFNSATRELNTAVLTFPGNLIAKPLGFHTEFMFEIPSDDIESCKSAPQIKF